MYSNSRCALSAQVYGKSRDMPQTKKKSHYPEAETMANIVGVCSRISHRMRIHGLGGKENLSWEWISFCLCHTLHPIYKRTIGNNPT